jgi:hypothetical protein
MGKAGTPGTTVGGSDFQINCPTGGSGILTGSELIDM